MTEKLIPILPCPDIKIQVSFYEALGFDVLGIYTSPNPYAALQWKNMEVHFYGSRKVIATQNSAMCFLFVNNVDEVNDAFTNALKKFYGKIPRTGVPMISKVRSLVYDRRFTLTDPGGNTFYIGSKNTDQFFRTLHHQQYAKGFAALYDVLYSKEDRNLAETMLPKYAHFYEELKGLDKAKFLLLVLDIQKQMVDNDALNNLIQGETGEDWDRIRQRLEEINTYEE